MLEKLLLGIPVGVQIRRLHTNRRAVGQMKPFTYSGTHFGKPGVVYGNTIKEVLKRLESERAQGGIAQEV